MSDWKTIYSFPLSSREGELAVFSTGPVCREDMETLAEVITIGIKVWPTLEEAQSYWRCSSCEWRGAQSKRILREGEGQTGCPRCGCKTTPLRALPGQPPLSVLDPALDEQGEEATP